MSAPRYTVVLVSVGEAGLTARPAVWDTVELRTVHTYRQDQRKLAEAMAAKLNAQEWDMFRGSEGFR